MNELRIDEVSVMNSVVIDELLEACKHIDIAVNAFSSLGFEECRACSTALKTKEVLLTLVLATEKFNEIRGKGSAA